jgi:aubergine-like protein
MVIIKLHIEKLIYYTSLLIAEIHERKNIQPGNGSTSKQCGKEVSLLTNYFKLLPNENFELTEYSIEIKPEEDEMKFPWTEIQKRKFVRQHYDYFGGYLYASNKIYLMRKLESEKISKIIQYKDEKYQMELKFTCFVELSNHQVLNIILRGMLGGLKLEQVGRNYFDPHHPVIIFQNSTVKFIKYENIFRFPSKTLNYNSGLDTLHLSGIIQKTIFYFVWT